MDAIIVCLVIQQIESRLTRLLGTVIGIATVWYIVKPNTIDNRIQWIIFRISQTTVLNWLSRSDMRAMILANSYKMVGRNVTAGTLDLTTVAPLDTVEADLRTEVVFALERQ